MWRHAAVSRAVRQLSVSRSEVLCASLRTSLHGARVTASRQLSVSRPVAAPTGSIADTLANSGYPDHSMSLNLLQKCAEAAVGRGVDVAAEYHPWLPVDLFQTMLVDVHEYTGCSWMTAIVFTCLGIRLISLPITVSAMRGAREKAILQPEFQELTAKQNALQLEGDQEKTQEIQKKIQAFTQKHGKFFMLRGTGNLLLFQMPLYVTAFAAIRGIASHPDMFRGFAMEAPLWLDSLALADPYYILPVLTGCIMLTNAELFGSIDTEAAAASPVGETTEPAAAAGGAAAVGQNTLQKYQKHFMRGSAIMFIPLTMSFPAGVFVFMSTNMLASTFQNRLLRNPSMERLLELPPRVEELKKQDITIKSGVPALAPLGLALKSRPSHSLLGTPERAPSSQAGSASAQQADVRRPQRAALQERLREELAATHAQTSASLLESATMLAKVNPRFSVRRRSRAEVS
eukprot:TRINITY_DN30366_c0_g1_i1.p1 TRINITY_DN30366_c0_g1~~TRINITY_DN30366_c0_g1_i1.p1  ORF type:complete len:471 (-),score=93.68 TRINITY_DN30366_c0_g1_i1:48-1424(-)